MASWMILDQRCQRLNAACPVAAPGQDWRAERRKTKDERQKTSSSHPNRQVWTVSCTVQYSTVQAVQHCPGLVCIRPRLAPPGQRAPKAQIWKSARVYQSPTDWTQSSGYSSLKAGRSKEQYSTVPLYCTKYILYYHFPSKGVSGSEA